MRRGVSRLTTPVHGRPVDAVPRAFLVLVAIVVLSFAGFWLICSI